MPGIRACRRLRISDTGETLEQLRHGDIEIGVVGGRVGNDELRFESLAQERSSWQCPAPGVLSRLTRAFLAYRRETSATPADGA